MTKVEPSGDDTLTEILKEYARSEYLVSEESAEPTLTLEAARTQLLQYIEGEKRTAIIEELEHILPNIKASNGRHRDFKTDMVGYIEARLERLHG